MRRYGILFWIIQLALDFLIWEDKRAGFSKIFLSAFNYSYCYVYSVNHSDKLFQQQSQNLIHYSENIYNSIVFGRLYCCAQVQSRENTRYLPTSYCNTIPTLLLRNYSFRYFEVSFTKQSYDKVSHTPLSFCSLLLFCCNCNFIVKELEQLEVLKAYYTVD